MDIDKELEEARKGAYTASSSAAAYLAARSATSAYLAAELSAYYAALYSAIAVSSAEERLKQVEMIKEMLWVK